tara:strand:- start:64 stop:225 length:162 start_codon:yes stop_codon:yes gene_type:complete
MVCLGNICKSLLAVGILKNYLPKIFISNSAGTASYHVEKLPDFGSVNIGKKKY